MGEHKVHVYKDLAGEWRWTRKAPNGRTVADSGEGYTDHAHALKMACELNTDAEILDHVGPKLLP